MPLETGSRFGRYTIEALVGEGGMGAVYRAFDTVLHRRVALKVLHTDKRSGSKGEQGTERILREARAAAALHHPNAVAIFDLGEHEGVAFIAMELCAGRSLREAMRAGGAPLDRRLRWIVEIGRALSAAHRVGVAHLDVKPENVMIGADFGVKVLDFGIARQVRLEDDPYAATATITAQGALTGTPAYMAPEQVRKLGVDSRSDQFAWGVVAYELLGGRLPWSEPKSLFDLLTAIVHEVPLPLRELHPEVPEEVEAVVMRALDKRPEARFPSMASLLEELDAVPLPPSQESRAPGADGPRSSASWRSRPSPSAQTLASTPTGRVTPVPVEPPRDGTASGPDPRAPAEPADTAGVGPSPPSAGQAVPTPPARVASRWKIGAAALVAALAVAIGARALVAARGPARAAEPAQVTLTELPPPPGCNAPALAQYRAGIQATHEGDWDEARGRFEEATRADPECAGAHLRLVLTAKNAFSSAHLREVYQRAVQLRHSLDARDRLFLDALDPLVRRDPTDESDFAARMVALARERPGDAEIVYYAGVYQQDPGVRIDYARRALAIDPQYSDAFQLLAGIHKRAGRTDEALGVLDECVRAAPSSIDCIKERMDLHRLRGQCADVVADARLWIAGAPRSSNGYFSLALGLASQGAPLGAVEEALRQRWSRLPEAERAQRQPLETAQLDALAGRFERAAEMAGEADRLVASDPSYDRHAPPALLLVDLDRELGRVERAAARAVDFLGRIPVWSANLGSGSDLVRTMHLEPLLLDAAFQGKKLSEPEWRSARAAWIESTRRTRQLDEPALWAVGVAMAARTPAEATDALRSMPPELRASGATFYPEVLSMGVYVGRALLLGGDVDGAVPFLRRAAGHCDALVIPFEDTHAHRWLGEALEKKGDTSGACAAYRVVLRRWGQAAPPPESAATAKARLAALACPP